MAGRGGSYEGRVRNKVCKLCGLPTNRSLVCGPCLIDERQTAKTEGRGARSAAELVEAKEYERRRRGE